MITDTQKVQAMERRLALRYYFGINDATLHAELDHVQLKAKQRTLDHGDLDSFLDDIEEMIGLALQQDISLYKLSGWMDGGAVSNSYKYPSEATYVSVRNGKIDIYRNSAKRRSGGRGASSTLGFTGLDDNTKKRLKALGWSGSGGSWKP